MPRVVKLVKRKLNGNDGSWLTYRLGDDEVGSWLFHPEGTSYTGRWADGREATCFSGIPEEPGCPVLYFAPHQGGWVAAWRRTPRTAITIDLSRACGGHSGQKRFHRLVVSVVGTAGEDRWMRPSTPAGGAARR